MTQHKTPSSRPYSPVRPDVNIPEQEQNILNFWDQQKIFEKSTQRPESKPYSFYDGPPFATGLPHYGHLLAGILKDIVPRYWTMQGHSIPRRFGWDCHGVPVEFEINKAHKLESRKQILEMGVAKYNGLCRSIVTRYSQEWKRTVKRIGRWVDMENAYFTMNPEFMESVWWVFKQLWDKGYIYEGYKVVPYSVGISTPLSNFEANLNYKQVQDPALTVTFPLTRDPDTSFLAWTTTPWTLPSNLGLAVGETIEYVKVREVSSGKQFILAHALLRGCWKTPEKEVEILETFPGSKLLGETYTPLFDYFSSLSAKGAFRVIPSGHVTTESGTGIVHMAPAYGEEDYQACAKAGIPIVNPVDDDGMFTSEVPEHAGKRVKEADKDIIHTLKGKHRLFKQDTIEHSYPYCYRSDTPLIYRAVSSWFVAVEKFRDRLVANNKTTTWVPETIRDGRFGNWLENARDWAISRNRFWGTPLPVWQNKEGEVMCVGSREELEKLSGQRLDDLHMEFVEKVTIPSPTGKSPLKHVGSVLDCWFESGSMPYAQWGYPKTNSKVFHDTFPADFIAEGLDQTRGWFYTLMVIGTALFDQAPFKNVIVNGLILAEDGKKMSKSLRNYPDPNEVLNEHGADALRLYLIDSPAVKAQELRFSEKNVRDVVRKILLRWWNSYSFFVNYANIDGFQPRRDFDKSPNILDQWILSRLHTLIASTEREMAAYRLYNVVPQLLLFVEELTNTYIRFNRPHFWQEGMPEDKRLAYETLYEVLVTFSKVMAPFAPFMSETIYQNLKQTLPGARESVHLELFPHAVERYRRPELEDAVTRMETLMMLGRNYREQIKVKAKIPLRSLRIIHRSPQVLNAMKVLETYIREELNVEKIEFTSDEDRYVQISAKANFPALGPRLGGKMKQVAGAIAKLGIEDLLKLENGATLTLEGEGVSLADMEIRRAPKGANANLLTHQLISIEFDPTVTPEQIQVGLAREVVRKIQAARKNADLNLDDRIRVELKAPTELAEAARVHQTLIQDATLAKELVLSASPQGQHTETVDIDEGQLTIALTVLAR